MLKLINYYVSEIITYIIVKKGNNMIGIIEWGRNADGAKLNDKGRENVWGRYYGF